jgi:hypothetical protein
MNDRSRSVVAVCRRVACLLSTRFRRTIRSMKTLPHTCACAFHHPHVQYRTALALATILAFLLGWPLFLSTVSHVPSAFIGSA